MYYVGVDIGGTKVNIGLFDEENRLICNAKIKVQKNPDALFSSIAESLFDLLQTNGIEKQEIMGCGIGIPGTVSEDKKTAIKIPNLGIENLNIAELFYKYTGFKSVVIQDSRAAALGEYTSGNARQSKSLICITLGTGIGTGVILNGKIYSGFASSAGELGHFPAIPNGRECGCGKRGCVECYSAGKGLDITAKELYGENATAITLFDNAKAGDKKAVDAIINAVELLGKVIVGAVNLLSPDTLIFSGGLSAQKEFFVEPLKEYILNHKYKTDGEKEMEIKDAFWGENAPLAGAAAYAKEYCKRPPMFSASIMCADLLNLEKDIRKLEQAKIDYIHFDIMDAHFVNNLMLPTMLVDAVARTTDIPLDIHLMVENPDSIIEQLSLRENDIVAVHYESTVHIQRTLSLIKQKGAKAAVAINPGTPIWVLEDLLCDIDMVLIMTVNPGFAGQKITSGSFNKITKAREYLSKMGYDNLIIEVDGNCSFENVPKLYSAGADIFVVGSSSVFNKDYTIETATKKLREDCK
ncbi:MAG: ribulose-phosphate 3-epimerase [Clostridia bacterium]|nr:ribulose-phosphate 3-epimerase [Clostridia bacterium]